MPTTSHDTPLFSLTAAEALVQGHYGLSLKATALPGEWDKNILLSDKNGPVAVLKISHAAQERGWLELENAVLEHLAQRLPEIGFPRLVPALNGQTLLSCTSESGTPHLTRLISYLPGTLYAHARPPNRRLLVSLGTSLARVDQALAGFSHPQLQRSLKWDLSQALWIEADLECVEAGEKRERIAAVLADYRQEFVPRQAALRQQALYNDANDYNILVQGGEVSGFIDLGDMVESALINELAIAAAYALMGQPAPLDAACALVAAYHQTLPLTEDELAVLWTLIQARLAVSVVNSAIERTAHPENTYLAISEAPAWELLARMAALSPAKAHYALRAACGFPTHPDTAPIEAWLAANTAAFAAVVPIDPRTQPSALIDLSVGSLELGGGDCWSADEIEAILATKRRESGAELILGRYLEPRLLYAFPAFDQPGLERTEHRTVHLGADLFLPHGTPVFAPLAGTVVSVVDNLGAGNYGPTVILAHQASKTDLTFFTLYGHLDPACLASLRVGQVIEREQCFAVLGRREHNGGWPPHLHFQILLDLLGCEGDFPGVARPAERALYAGVCPDPNLILDVPGGICGEPEGNASLLTRRHKSIGPSLSISYEEPLQIVRGYRQNLYTADGQAFLDMVNNVPHVGHSNPRVVQAALRQLAVLNTNSRYLHPLMEAYAEALTATLPAPLSVCYFVNSGSEANELALRLARAATGRQGALVVDAAYHGNTSLLVDLSPYKNEGKGGRGAPDWVQKLPLPDPYRGAFRGPDCGLRYAALADEVLSALEEAGHPIGMFIAESILGCGGQIVLPEGYLREVYRQVRARGGVCVADEVQVGFGRAGTHFWAFEHQGVVPDIVTLGKPIGNGWPLGAVITTPTIAAAFNNGMEYFNTFGGNPASLAAGQAVLKEIEEKQLQANALTVGNRILDGLRALQTRYLVIGDVRGLGLYIGAELVKDRITQEPFAAAASHVANRLKDFGVLISTDGPHHNVLKIKPPLIVTLDDADQLLTALDRALAEDAAQQP